MVVLLILAGINTVFAEGNDTGDTDSKFENFLLAKGSLIVKEFIDFKEIGSTGVKLQIATLTNVENGEIYRALRLTFQYYNSQYDNGEAVGVLDADEVDSVITTLEYIKQRLSAGLKDYTEIIYTANSGLKVGAYKASYGDSLFLEASSKSAFVKTVYIDAFITTLKEAKEKLM
jgi:hypothetical protein